MASAIQDGGEADRNKRVSRNGLERIQNRLPQPPPPGGEDLVYAVVVQVGVSV